MNAVALTSSDRQDAVATSSRGAWFGRALSGLVLLFLTFDAAVKLLMLPVALEASMELGFDAPAIFAVGAIEAVCVALYLVPRTSILGAVLWVGYFGGAIATHVQAGSPLFTHVLSPIYFAAMLWVGVWLRDERLRRAVRVVLEPSGARSA